MNKTVMAAALVAASSLAGASLAHADVISLGIAVNGGAIDTLSTSTTGTDAYGTSGTGYSVSITGYGSPPLTDGSLLQSQTLDFTSIGLSDTYTIYVSESDITSYTGLEDFLSSFTENTLTAGWTVTESTYLDTADGVYGLDTLLGTTTFGGIGTNIQSLTTDAGSGPYSVTAVYTITPNGITGSDNSTINVNVPEPATFALFGAGLLGFAFLGRRRNSTKS